MRDASGGFFFARLHSAILLVGTFRACERRGISAAGGPADLARAQPEV